MKAKLIILTLAMIGFGFKAISQTVYTITPAQLKKIRLLVNRSERDSLLIISYENEIRLLNKNIENQSEIIKNCEKKEDYLKQIIASKDTLISNKELQKNMCFKENKKLHKKLKISKVVVTVSFLANLIFLIKTF